MRYSIEITAALDFCPEERKVGTLEYERIKGGATYLFSFDESFIRDFPNIRLSRDLGNYTGVQSSSPSIFRCFSDTLPDRWGKALIDKRERLRAAEEHRLPRTFDDFGYLVRLDDFSRMGAFRFKHKGDYIGTEKIARNVPILSDLPEIVRHSHQIEKSENEGTQPSLEWIENLWIQGSSLGGARPKANILDEDGILHIAKIPSFNDTYDVALWEHFACSLARQSGVDSIETRLLDLEGMDHHALLSKRFDRNGKKRIHFASAITLVGLKDGDGVVTGKGYPDIADTIVGDAGIADPTGNLEELFRRIAFNICIGNHDDHFRNHGFLLGPAGWGLSPAYDLNPTNYYSQSLLVSPTSNNASLNELLAASDYYLIEKPRAKQLIVEVLDGIAGWRCVANACGIDNKERQRFASRFDNNKFV